MRGLKRLAGLPVSIDLGLLLLRVGFGLALALAHGWRKVVGLDAFTASVASKGLPLPAVLAPLGAATEFLGGLLLVLGLFTRPAALFVLVTMLVAATQGHAGQAFARRELALAYAVVALALLVAGPGRHSLDARR
jgi:putative oxidoreductase